METVAQLVPRRTAEELRRFSQEIHQAVASLYRVNRWYGWSRLALLIGLLFTGGWMYWRADHWTLSLAGLVVLALAESALLIATHEALHGTLLALPRWEFLFSCLVSWPMACPSCTYGLVHLWHHRWNSVDLRDPERIPVCRRPWLKRILGSGGIGLIVSTVHQGLLLRHEDPRLPWRLGWDAAGIFLLHTSLLWLVIAQGVFGRYLLSWLIVERIVGAILQSRALVEHWGLWHPRQNHLLSQLYGSRTIGVNYFFNQLMGGLPYHSVHHACPSLPSHSLPEACERIDKLLKDYRLPSLPYSHNYPMAIASLFKRST